MQKWAVIPWEKYLDIQQSEENDQTGSGESHLSTDSILAAIPKRSRSNAEAILLHIQRDPDISWNSKGELEIKDTSIPNSHLVDLLKDSTHNFKHNWEPAGVSEFYRALAKSNLPLGLIQNKTRRELLENYKQMKPSETLSKKWLTWN